MDLQDIGIPLVMALLFGGIIYTLVSRSKKSGYAIEEKY
jgi:hypothetical protein